MFPKIYREPGTWRLRKQEQTGGRAIDEQENSQDF